MASCVFQPQPNFPHQAVLTLTNQKNAFDENDPYITSFTQEYNLPYEVHTAGGPNGFMGLKEIFGDGFYEPWRDALVADAITLAQNDNTESISLKNGILNVIYASLLFGQLTADRTLTFPRACMWLWQCGYSVSILGSKPVVEFWIYGYVVSYVSNPISNSTGKITLNSQTPLTLILTMIQIMKNTNQSNTTWNYNYAKGAPTVTVNRLETNTLQPTIVETLFLVGIYGPISVGEVPLAWTSQNGTLLMPIGITPGPNTSNPTLRFYATQIEPRYGQCMYCWTTKETPTLFTTTTFKTYPIDKLTGPQIMLSILGCSPQVTQTQDFYYFPVFTSTFDPLANMKIYPYQYWLSSNLTSTGYFYITFSLNSANYFGNLSTAFIYAQNIATGVYGGTIVDSVPYVVQLANSVYEYSQSDRQIDGNNYIEQVPPTPKTISGSMPWVGIYNGLATNFRKYRNFKIDILNVWGLKIPFFIGGLALQFVFFDPNVSQDRVAFYNY